MSYPLVLRELVTGERIEISPARLVIAGFTGRDEAAVAEHIDELAALGVPAPQQVPAFYELAPDLLSTGPLVEVAGSNTSGEVEPVLIRHGQRILLGIGSDHTDRDAERVDIARSKAICPKPIGDRVIELPADLDTFDWDATVVESRVDGADYQRGSLAGLRTPTDLLARMQRALGEVTDDLVVFAGTLPLLGSQFVPGTRWELSLRMPDGVVLSHAYDVKRRIG